MINTNLRQYRKNLTVTDLMRYHIIQRLIDHHGYECYLEIGIHNGDTWNKIQCDNKRGIDPDKCLDSPFISETTSDEYFAYHDRMVDSRFEVQWLFDIVFIDGLHRAEQVWRDIRNSLKYLKPGGCIVLHDTNPPTLAHAGPEPEIYKETLPSGEPHYVWCGTVWQIMCWITHYAAESINNYFTVDTDWGVTVIYPAQDRKTWVESISEVSSKELWGQFLTNRKRVLNLITADEFHKRYPPHA